MIGRLEYSRGRMRSIFYRSPLLYDLLMLTLYRRAFTRRLACIADLVEPGSSVLEVCCGPARLAPYLRARDATYTGIDVSPEFVARARGRGINAKVVDIEREDLPHAEHDVVIMQASLYQFHPRCREVLDRLLAAARRSVIISEPVRNLASSKNPLLAGVARRLTDAGRGEAEFRFNEESLRELLRPLQHQVEQTGLIFGGREMYAVLRA